ncbi:hypothetical protein [Streptomyces sp. NEAU-YJ-81]|uniref:hypothetical protein n=1 Tax=Streptomyces sp. NEAU-YJ-81 TaxID=2820288 RepID=UPI001ABD14B3|nr:hypothetical protein [Streptomyces sp. NEAU-YJ-81]MBO3680247.1 hypothetical protein [Streptomyces sp. NEAU-YJ-81]
MDGAGILDLGSLTLNQSPVTADVASGIGGGIQVGPGATASLTLSNVSGNTANDGGGMHVDTGPR